MPVEYYFNEYFFMLKPMIVNKVISIKKPSVFADGLFSIIKKYYTINKFAIATVSIVLNGSSNASDPAIDGIAGPFAPLFTVDVLNPA